MLVNTVADAGWRGGGGGKAEGERGQTLKTHLLFLSYRKDRGRDLWRVTCVSLS